MKPNYRMQGELQNREALPFMVATLLDLKDVCGFNQMGLMGMTDFIFSHPELMLGTSW